MHIHHRTFTALAIAAAGALGGPAIADASQITLPGGTCFEQGVLTSAVGTGFTPDITMQYNLGEGTSTDENGTFEAWFSPPEVNTFTPQTKTFEAYDVFNPANNNRIDFQVVQFGTNFPVDKGRPSDVVQWQFAGFPAGKTIYGHFRTGNKTKKTYRFGKASGPCGTLTVKAPRIPVKGAKLRTGWYVQVDTSAKYLYNRRGNYNRTF